jgi:DNA-binding PadR family transcriptional regulator
MTELDLLVLLAVQRLGDDAYGVTVLEELERRTRRTLNLGTVYRTLARLSEKDYVSARVAPPTGERGGRRKKLYRPTGTGLMAARDAVADLRRLTQGLDPELELS